LSLTSPLELAEKIWHIVLSVCTSFVFQADAKFLDISVSHFSPETFMETYPLPQFGNIWAKGQKLKK
jgi:hypothetical protein